MEKSFKKIVCIAGMTGSGKSSLAYNLAQRINGEVCVVDHCQAYKEFPVLTNHPCLEWQNSVCYHNLATHSLSEEVNSAQFCDRIWKSIEKIQSKDKVPILEGGSMFYFNNFITGGGFVFSDEEARKLNQFEEEAESFFKQAGTFEKAVEAVKQLDSTVPRINKNDYYRLTKAYGNAKLWGEGGNELVRKRDEQVREQNKARFSDTTVLKYFTFDDKEAMRSKLSKRTLEQLNSTLLEEVIFLLKNMDTVDKLRNSVFNSIGTKECLEFLSTVNKTVNTAILKENDLSTAKQKRLFRVNKAKLEGEMDKLAHNIYVSSRRYAKKQLMWFNKKQNFEFLKAESAENLVEKVQKDFEKGEQAFNFTKIALEPLKNDKISELDREKTEELTRKVLEILEENQEEIAKIDSFL